MKTPQQIIKEREELFIKDYNQVFPIGRKVDTTILLNLIKINNTQTLHLLLDALIEREEEKPDGYDMMSGKISEYELEGYHKAKQDTITHLKELKDLINQHK